MVSTLRVAKLFILKISSAPLLPNIPEQNHAQRRRERGLLIFFWLLGF
jgi:hypothetical protein